MEPNGSISLVTLDFEKYAEEKAMKGAVPESWIRPFQESVLCRFKDHKNVRILDYGFGDGRYYEFFSKYFEQGNIYGVEVSRLRVERAQARGWHNAIYLDMMTRLPYEDGFFNFINMVEVIEHIPIQHVSFYFSELVRVIRPEGVLLLTTPNYPIKRFYDLFDAFFSKKWERLRDDPTHVTFYNHEKLNRLLRKSFESISFLPYKNGFLYNRLPIDFFLHKILVICIRKT